MKSFIPWLFHNFSFIASAVPVALSSPNLSLKGPSHYPCDCYLVSGSDPGYFTDYKFWDFRGVPLPHIFRKGTYNPSTEDTWESDILSLSQSGFSTEWQAQTWSRDRTVDSKVPVVNSDRNTFFARHPEEPDTSQLVLRTTRLENYSSTAEIESQQANFYHCSLRIRMRIMSMETMSRVPAAMDAEPENNTVPTGACAGVFTYRSANCESDLEFLTSDPPNTIHYANQPDYDPIMDLVIPDAGKVVSTLPAPWTSWATHRMDWFPNATSWYVNNLFQTNISYGVPDRPSIIALNLWSDGGEWTGDMALNESVYMGIEWMEIAYNTSTTDLPADNTTQRHRHRTSKRGKREKMQFGVNEVEKATRCERPCYLDKMQHF